MTESEAIEACKKKAAAQRTRLGSNIQAYFVDDGSTTSENELQAMLPNRHWDIIFWSGFGTEQYFIVNDSTGEVIWNNDLPARWLLWLLNIAMISLYLLLIPLYLLLIPFAFVFERVRAAWKYFRLPRCPYCRGKLRTDSAEQCFTCGKAWHRKSGLDS